MYLVTFILNLHISLTKYLIIMSFSKLLVIPIFLFAYTGVNAQKQFTVCLTFPSNLDKEKIRLFYDNGQDDHIVVQNDFTDNQITISKPFYSKYATISVSYQGKNARFWVSEKASVINFIHSDSAANILQNVKLSNAFAVDKTEAHKSMIKYISAETKDLEDFRTSNKEWFRKDSLILIYEEKNRKLTSKKIRFVQNNGDSYYSFWLFRRELV